MQATCPACGRANRDDARFCDGCGTPLHASEARRAAAREAGRTFAGGRYRDLRLLGEGADKRVFLGRDVRLGRDVAIAILKTGGLDVEGRLRIEREARTLARLSGHPHIVSIYDVGTDDEDVYIVAQYMPGGDLASRLRRSPDGRLAIRDALQIASEVLDAVQHAHAHGVIHRDLKPANIFLDSNGHAALGDFGLARVADLSRITEEGLVVGTIAYMAPEQALGGKLEPASDLYALGVTLYELLAGRPPFQADDHIAVITQHLNTPPVALSWHNPEIPRALDELVAGLLAKHPDARPTAVQVREAIARLIHAIDARISQSRVMATNPLDRLAGGVVVGRDAEIRRLREAFDTAVGGRGRVVLVSGEGGIGKTRLVEVLATYARLRGAQVFWGHCRVMEGAPAYWPWIQVLREQVEREGPEIVREELGSDAALIGALVPKLHRELPEDSPAALGESEHARFRLFDAIGHFLRNASLRHPLVLVFEDVTSADPTSLLLLRFLAPEVARSRLLFVATYRDEEATRQQPVTDALAELTRITATDHLVLGGITEPDVRRFIELVAGVDPSDELVGAVYKETDGNPFFVTEIVRLLIGQRGADGLTEHERHPLPVPETVRDVIGQRLHQRSQTCTAVLSVASVLGKDFDSRLLERPCEVSGDQLRAALEEAEQARLVQASPRAPDRYSFSHALVRETLYDQLGARRARWHALLGEEIERQADDEPGERLPDLAHHFLAGLAAGIPAKKARDYCVRAAERAMSVLGYEEAVAHYENALATLAPGERGEREERCETLLALGNALWKTSETRRSRETFQRAAELARELGNGRALAEAALGYGGTGYTGLFETTGVVDRSYVDLLDSALGQLPEQESRLRARLLGRLGIALYWDRSSKRREVLTEEAVELAKRLGDPIDEWHALIARHRATWGPENLRERLARTERLIEIGQGVRSPELTAGARIFRIAHLLESGDTTGADEELAAYARTAEQLREPQYQWRALLMSATRALMRGELAQMEELTFEAFRVSRLMPDPSRIQAFGLQLAMLRREQGRLGEIEAAIEDMLRRFPTILSWRSASGVVFFELGRIEDARGELAAIGSNDFADLPRDYLWLSGMAGSAELCALLGDTARAAVLYDLLAPYSDRYVIVGDAIAAVGPGEWYLGLLAATIGRADEARTHFERAIERCRALKVPLYEARARLDLAALLVRCYAAHCAEIAKRHREQAEAIGRRLGSQLILEKARRCGLKR